MTTSMIHLTTGLNVRRNDYRFNDGMIFPGVSPEYDIVSSNGNEKEKDDRESWKARVNDDGRTTVRCMRMDSGPSSRGIKDVNIRYEVKI